MINKILQKVEFSIKSLLKSLRKKPLTDKQKTTLTKREQVPNLLKKMARKMDLPRQDIDSLNELDWSIASDQQIDSMLGHLTTIVDIMGQTEKQTGIDMKTALQIHKTKNN